MTCEHRRIRFIRRSASSEDPMDRSSPEEYVRKRIMAKISPRTLGKRDDPWLRSIRVQVCFV